MGSTPNIITSVLSITTILAVIIFFFFPMCCMRPLKSFYKSIPERLLRRRNKNINERTESSYGSIRQTLIAEA
ncbi:hypothetical protein TRFO_07440 [Tritrichomonas foetus]|uniref:Uncharacterized protein n=1 Tax=Tritrichomonas foetus TaxID=1144522 RepID=A0A1J4JS36_9EUKA|nr:hypothetical protein TRFO_07440 [Tritrichomonas foetus]|eukprot:OHT01859.1 hypothetical protein TRFO_07440 [Tritrichomonas foetus]